MIATSSRKALVGVAAIAALALAGCTPPNENPSDKKIDTATSQDAGSLKGAGASATAATNVVEASEATATETLEAAADELPTFNNCGETGLLRPTQLTVDCKSQNDFLQDIVWDTWTEDLAEGTATRVVLDPNNREEGVKVVLGAPQVLNNDLLFTTISVDGATVNPDRL